MHSLLPIPLWPRIKTPTPRISAMLPNSVTVGEKSTSSAMVAALINFIVIMGVRNTAIFSSADRQQRRIEMKSARDHETRNFSSAEIAKAFYAKSLRQTFEVGMLSRAEDLDALLREVTEETGKRQTRAINRGLANFPMKSHSRTFQLHVQLFRVQIVKALDRDNGHALLQIACRCNRLGAAALRHKHLTCNAEAARFPMCIAR